MENGNKTDISLEGIPVPLSVHIFQILREQIITGKLEEGARLNELLLQKTFGTSRSPIREAFHRLETEGLVEISPRRGAFVRSISAGDVIEATAVRSCLEALALRLAPRPIPPARLEELSKILHLMNEAVDKRDIEGFTRHHWRFHRGIIDLSGNQILIRIYPAVTEPFISHRFTYRYLKNPERFAGVGHQEIYDLLASGQVLKAARMMELHAKAFVDHASGVKGAKSQTKGTDIPIRKET
jgi:DNA-binding GntR family transcriptional regulator